MIAVSLVAVTIAPTGVTRLYTFQDEFDGPVGAAPDPKKWAHDLGGGGWGNNELQIYTNSRRNSFLDGAGNLVLRATKVEPNSSRNGTGQTTYNSARLKTQDTFTQQGGHWEARLKIDSRRGLWPAWWMLGDNIGQVGWPRCGEVDILEDYGFSAVESSVHAASGSDGIRSFAQSMESDDEFHVFRLDWSTDGMRFFRDGVEYGRLDWRSRPADKSLDPRQPMFMLLNLAVGGDIGNPPHDVTFPVDLTVDYVRVWK